VAAVIPLSDDPPMLLASMNQSSSTHGAVLEAGSFAVNVLAEGQGWIARQFAGKGDKFAGVEHYTCRHTGAPLLDGVLATVSCRLETSAAAGSHTALFGAALAATDSAGRPLTYFGGSFGRWDRLREHDTYDQVRLLVLRREVPVGQELDVADLASRLDARPDDVHNALIKLSTESLVDRRSDGGFEPAPIGFELVESLYDARANIEIGVVANHVGRIPESVLHHLQELVARMKVLRRSSDGANPGEFLSLHREHHMALVALSGSNELMESYRRLHIAWVWRSIWEQLDWKRNLSPRHLEELTDALVAADLQRAIRAIQDYHSEAKDLARIALERRGGIL
jgi:4-nitrophenol 2-monooxygenase / 4-nitrocatechol 4-monooxygenase, reductase component